MVVSAKNRGAGVAEAQDSWRKKRFRVIYTDTYPAVQRYCRRRLPDSQAEDVLSETFTVAWSRLDDVPVGDSALPWLYAVARNVVRNQYRRTERSGALTERLVDHLEQVPNDPGSPPGLDGDERRALAEALESLKEADRELIRLTVWEELPHSAIAIVLGCSENAVTVRLHRARGRLTKKLERDQRWSRTSAPVGTSASVSAEKLEPKEADPKEEIVKGHLTVGHMQIDGASDQAKGAKR